MAGLRLAEPIELGGIVAGDLAPSGFRQMAELALEIVLRVRPDAVGMRVVRTPHHVVPAKLVDEHDADAIGDLVQSGGTLVANQLRETDVLLESEAVLAAAGTPPADERGDMLELLLKRLDGVIQVRESRLLLLQTSRQTLEAVTRLLPGGPQPTLMPVAGQPDQLMLQALCAGEVSWRQLEEIKKAGAREMFVLPVEKMLA